MPLVTHPRSPLLDLTRPTLTLMADQFKWIYLVLQWVRGTVAVYPKHQYLCVLPCLRPPHVSISQARVAGGQARPRRWPAFRGGKQHRATWCLHHNTSMFCCDFVNILIDVKMKITQNKRVKERIKVEAGDVTRHNPPSQAVQWKYSTIVQWNSPKEMEALLFTILKWSKWYCTKLIENSTSHQLYSPSLIFHH